MIDSSFFKKRTIRSHIEVKTANSIDGYFALTSGIYRRLYIWHCNKRYDLYKFIWATAIIMAVYSSFPYFIIINE